MIRYKHQVVWIIFGIVALSIVAIGRAANSWQAVDTITCKKLDILYPNSPDDVAMPRGGHEIQFVILEENRLRLGETTGWLSKCFGRCCLTGRSRNFELNTFSDHGLMYVRPD